MSSTSQGRGRWFASVQTTKISQVNSAPRLHSSVSQLRSAALHRQPHRKRQQEVQSDAPLMQHPNRPSCLTLEPDPQHTYILHDTSVCISSQGGFRLSDAPLALPEASVAIRIQKMSTLHADNGGTGNSPTDRRATVTPSTQGSRQAETINNCIIIYYSYSNISCRSDGLTPAIEQVQ